MKKQFKNLNGKLIILSAPSGCGKSTITNMLIDNNRNNSKDDNIYIKSISTTTRLKREGEVDKEDYFFVSKDKFLSMIKNKELIEYATIYDNYYGTSLEFIEYNLQKNINIILDIDYQGMQQIYNILPKEKLISIFIMPPSIEILRKRLLKRAQDNKKTIEIRMNSATAEMANSKYYDHVVTNDILEKAVNKIQHIIDNIIAK